MDSLIDKYHYSQVMCKLIFADKNNTALFEQGESILTGSNNEILRFTKQVKSFLIDAPCESYLKNCINNATESFFEKSKQVYEAVARLQTILIGKNEMEFQIKSKCDVFREELRIKCHKPMKNKILEKEQYSEYEDYLIIENNENRENRESRWDCKEMDIAFGVMNAIIDQAQEDTLAIMQKTTNPIYIVNFAQTYKTLKTECEHLYNITDLQKNLTKEYGGNLTEKDNNALIIKDGRLNFFPLNERIIRKYWETDPDEKECIDYVPSTIPEIAEGKKTVSLQPV